MTVQSMSAVIMTGTAPAAPTGLTGVIVNSVDLTWTDNAIDETGFTIQRADNGGAWATIATVGPNIAADPAVTGAVTYHDAGATPGRTYDYRVRADRDAASSAWSNTFHIVIPAVPAAPTNLTATLQMGATAPEVRLDFTDNAAGETGFTVQRSDNAAGWARPHAAPGHAGTAPSRTPTPRWCRVTPTTTRCARRPARRSCRPGPTRRPSSCRPSRTLHPDLTATLQAGATGPEVRLDFTDNATDETGFTVQRNNGTGWANLTTLAANPATGAVTYTDTTVAYGTSYDYRVRADNGPVVSSAWSNMVTVAVPARPAAPSGLTATVEASVTSPQVALAFTDNAGNETGFLLQRSVNGGAWADLVGLPSAAGTGSTVTLHRRRRDPGQHLRLPSPGPKRRHRRVGLVQTRRPRSCLLCRRLRPASPASSRLDRPSASAGPTSRPTSRATPCRGRPTAAPPGPPSPASLPAKSTGYVDTPVALATTYAYRVQCLQRDRLLRVEHVGRHRRCPRAPAAPTNLARTLLRTTAGPDTVNMTWTDNANNETGFVIQRATDNTFTANVMTFTAPANATSYSTTVAHGSTYYFRVQAVNVVAMSTWSNSVQVTTVPATPTNVGVTNIARTRITVTWSDVSTNETGYQVQFKRANNNGWQIATTTAANATSYRVINLNPDTAYDFRVRGVNGVGTSPWSASVRARTLR